MRMDPEQFLLAEIGRRESTDYRFSWGTYFGWSLLTFGAYSIYGTLRLIERRIEHVRRRLAVSSSLWHVLAANADARGIRPAVQEGLDNLSRIHAQIEDYERKHRRNPQVAVLIRTVAFLAAWAGLVVGSARYDPALPAARLDEIETAVGGVVLASMLVLFVSGAIVNALLADDVRFLDVWEASWADNVEWVMARIGLPAGIPARSPRRERTVGVSVLLTLVTAGLYSIVWRHALISDGNRHFDDDDRMEDAILAGLGLRPAAPGVPAPPNLPAP